MCVWEVEVWEGVERVKN